MINDRIYVLRTRWDCYVSEGTFELFIEFTVAVNSLAEHFNRMRLPGLVRLCEGLEHAAFECLGSPTSHPLAAQQRHALQRQLDTLLGAVATLRAPVVARRSDEHPTPTPALVTEWIKPRSVWLVAEPDARKTTQALQRQLDFYGFQTLELGWDKALPVEESPLAVLFMPPAAVSGELETEFIANVRARCATSQLIYVGAHPSLEAIVALMRAGIDITIPQDEGAPMVLNCVLDLVQNYEPEKFRVLVVEDSRVAVALIQRTLAEHNIDSRAIRDPAGLLAELEAYRPDLILMDMYMPHFNGVEATRALRQMSAYKALPIVYLSGETEIGKQVEALRLGGDQFLQKPFNPVLLAAVVKAKIERFRETQRSTRLDGLTGLLNHTAAKARLDAMFANVSPGRPLTVVMLDIDHFKAVNDTFGHPVGDQVIRSLAWLLKGRLRSSDLIGRYGGEEFLVALGDVSPDQARTVIDRIRADFSCVPHAHLHGALFGSFSAGIAATPDFGSAARLIEAADKALLNAKALGRNRVEMATI